MTGIKTKKRWTVECITEETARFVRAYFQALMGKHDFLTIVMHNHQPRTKAVVFIPADMIPSTSTELQGMFPGELMFITTPDSSEEVFAPKNRFDIECTDFVCLIKAYELIARLAPLNPDDLVLCGKDRFTIIINMTNRVRDQVEQLLGNEVGHSGFKMKNRGKVKIARET
jgi:hypothetical protein